MLINIRTTYFGENAVSWRIPPSSCHGKYTPIVENKNERTLFVETQKPLTHLLQDTTYIVPYHLFYVDEIKLILMIRHDSQYMVTECARPSSVSGILLSNLEHGFTKHTSRFLSLWIMKNGATGAKICIKLRMTAL